MTPKFKVGDLVYEPKSGSIAELPPFLVLEYQEIPPTFYAPIYVILQGEKIRNFNVNYVDEHCEKLV